MWIPDEVMRLCWLDGAYLPAREARVSAFDRGLLVADGIFETFGVEAGAPLGWTAHVARLERTARFVELTLPWDRAGLERVVRGLLARNGVDRDAPPAALRLTVTRGARPDGPPTAFAFLRHLTEAHLARRREGVRLHRLPFEGRAAGELSGHKTLSHIASAFGQIWLAARTDDPRAEGLFVTTAGSVVEGSATNVFAVEGDRVVTPPLASGALPGTARRHVLELAPNVGLDPREEPLTLERLLAADEAFVTASTLHVAPAVSLDGRPLGRGEAGPMTRRLAAAFEERVARDIAAWHAGD